MLSERVRNTIVGLTMLLALAALMVGIFMLGRFPDLGHRGSYTITLVAPNASGLSAGNKVNFNGVDIGTVNSITLTPDLRGVLIGVTIDWGRDIPSNAQVAVGKQTIGTPFVTFSLPSNPLNPLAPAPIGPPVPKDGSARMEASLADSGLIPKAVLDKITKVGDDLDLLLAQRSLTEFDKENPETRVANLSILVQRIDRVAKGVDTLVGDPQTQEKFRRIISDLQEASATLKTVMVTVNTTVTKANGVVDQVGTSVKQIGGAATQADETLRTTRGEILRVSEKLVDLLNSVQKSTDAIAKGEGTAGRLVNDPRLYDGLLDLTKSLKSTADDLNVLMRKWKDEGVQLNLK